MIKINNKNDRYTKFYTIFITHIATVETDSVKYFSE